MGIVTATIAVADDQLVPAPVSGVLVRVYDALDVFQSESVTDVTGEADFLLNGSGGGTEYIVRVFKSGVTFPETSTKFSINVLDPVAPPNTNTFDVLAHIPSLPESLNPYLCKLSGTFVDAGLRPVAGLTIEIKPPVRYADTDTRFLAPFYGDPISVANALMAKSVKVKTDKNGYVEFELPRTGVFEVHIQGHEHPLEITSFITVPDAAGFLFLDVLLPYVVQVTYGTDPIDLVVGGSGTTSVAALLSNQQTISTIQALRDVLDFTTDDDTVASVQYLEDGVLSVTGVKVGSTTIVATRKAVVVPRRIPAVPALVVTPPTVNVN